MTKAREVLIQQIGPARYRADWDNPRHLARRIFSEFLGTAALLFMLSTGATLLAVHADASASNLMHLGLMGLGVGLWLVATIYALSDVSSHWNPTITLAFALRGDLSWPVTGAYIAAQAAGAAAGSLTVRLLLGTAGRLGAASVRPGEDWSVAIIETILNAGLAVVVLSMVKGAKLKGPYIPIAVGAFVTSSIVMTGLYDGCGLNPARVFGPAAALGEFTGTWPFWVGGLAGAVLAAAIDRILRGPADAGEAAEVAGIEL